MVSDKVKGDLFFIATILIGINWLLSIGLYGDYIPKTTFGEIIVAMIIWLSIPLVVIFGMISCNYDKLSNGGVK